MSTRSALITGATQGIGLGIAQTLARHGHPITITGLDQGEVARALAKLEDFLGENNPGVNGVVADVTNPAQCDEAVNSHVSRFGGLDILASNAGIYPQVPLDELTAQQFLHVLNVNVVGSFNMIRSARQVLRNSNAGRIVLTSSITGPTTGFTGWAHYGASKAAQLGMMRTLAVELAPWGVTVNAVLPGNIATEGLADLGQAYLDSMAQAVPTGVLGTPTDIGEAVAFLASPGASFITGQALIVDGGQTLPESQEAIDLARQIYTNSKN